MLGDTAFQPRTNAVQIFRNISNFGEDSGSEELAANYRLLKMQVIIIDKVQVYYVWYYCQRFLKFQSLLPSES